MVGNDIVDLAEARQFCNWQRPRYLSKVFTKKEEDRIQNSVDPEQTVWAIWSAKEAAYKLYIQKHQGRFFNPEAFQYSTENSVSKVHYKDFKCFVKTTATSEFILSEARQHNFEMHTDFVRLTSNEAKIQTKETTAALLRTLSKTLNVPHTELNIQKSKDGVPLVRFGSESINVSLSHHGHFGAFAYCTDVNLLERVMITNKQERAELFA